MVVSATNGDFVGVKVAVLEKKPYLCGVCCEYSINYTKETQEDGSGRHEENRKIEFGEPQGIQVAEGRTIAN